MFVLKNWQGWHYFLVLKRIVMSFHFLLLKSGHVVSMASPPGRSGVVNTLTPPRGTGLARLRHLVRGTRLFTEDTWITLMISWPRPMLDLTRGCIEWRNEDVIRSLKGFGNENFFTFVFYLPLWNGKAMWEGILVFSPPYPTIPSRTYIEKAFNIYWMNILNSLKESAE